MFLLQSNAKPPNINSREHVCSTLVGPLVLTNLYRDLSLQQTNLFPYQAGLVLQSSVCAEV